MKNIKGDSKSGRPEALILIVLIVMALCAYYLSRDRVLVQQAPVPEKRLVRVEGRDSYGELYTTIFYYDVYGRLESTEYITPYDTTGKTYVYDDAGRLIEVWASQWGDIGPQYAYHYDDAGYLVEISGIGEGGGAGGTLVNDAQGRLIEYSASNDFGSQVYFYEYNQDGTEKTMNHVSTDAEGVMTVEHALFRYTYDSQGRVLSEIRESDSYSYHHVYSYDHGPVVTMADENELPFACWLEDAAGKSLWELNLSGAAGRMDVDADGYITHIEYVDENPLEINGNVYHRDMSYDLYYAEPEDAAQSGPTVFSTMATEEPVPESVYINELPFCDKYGKLWTMSENTPDYYVHTDVNDPEDWKDMVTPGHTTGPVYDYLGNRYTYGLHVDGDEYAAYYISYEINGMYTTFTGSCCMSPEMNGDNRAGMEKYFEVYGDGVRLFTSASMRQGASAYSFEVDITGVQVLTIQYPKTSGPSRIATIFDGKLK